MSVAGRLLTLLLIAGLAWLGYQVAADASRGGEMAPLYSVRRFDPYGTAALAQLLERRGNQVTLLERPRPPADLRQATLVQVLPVTSESSILEQSEPRLDSARLYDWVLAGNTVIQFTSERTPLMDRCGVPTLGAEDAGPGSFWGDAEVRMAVGTPPDELGLRSVPADLSTPGTQVLTVLLKSPGPLAAERTSLWQPLATTPDGMVVIGRQRVGQGALVVVSSPTPALNGWMAEADNAAALTALIGTGPVLVDEWSHGFGHGGTILALVRRIGLLPALAQIVLIIVLLQWSTRGTPVAAPRSAERRRSSVEQIVSLGQLYQQAMSQGELSRRTGHEVRQRLATALRTSVAHVERRMGSLKAPLRARVARVLAAADALQAERPHVPRCDNCGYNLTGNASAACPECGRPQSDEVATLPADASSEPTQQLEHQLSELLMSTDTITREIAIERRKRVRPA